MYDLLRILLSSTNTREKIESLWKIYLWIFTSARIFPGASNLAFEFFLFANGPGDRDSVLNRVMLKTSGIMVRVFTNGPGDLGSILDRVIPKTQEMVLDAALLNTQHKKVSIKGKVEQFREWSSALPYTLV